MTRGILTGIALFCPPLSVVVFWFLLFRVLPEYLSASHYGVSKHSRREWEWWPKLVLSIVNLLFSLLFIFSFLPLILLFINKHYAPITARQSLKIFISSLKEALGVRFLFFLRIFGLICLPLLTWRVLDYLFIRYLFKYKIIRSLELNLWDRRRITLFLLSFFLTVLISPFFLFHLLNDPSFLFLLSHPETRINFLVLSRLLFITVITSLLYELNYFASKNSAWREWWNRVFFISKKSAESSGLSVIKGKEFQLSILNR